ncbi:hypothetical protein EGW08_005177, partial [Elysia chlorotica]
VLLCQVCGDQAAGFYCGAYICEACKKFFIRASKLKQMKYVCLKQKNCNITKETRVHCQFCRYQKCLSLNMLYHKDGQKGEDKGNVQEIPCRVCSAPSSGFHFGALTCEGCKGFFRRMVNEREPGTYSCGRGGNCEVNSMTRNMCKACRYAKCLQIGMCIEGSRIGRQPNAVKHAISLEVKKQAACREGSLEKGERKPQKPLPFDEDSNTSTYSFDEFSEALHSSSVSTKACNCQDLDKHPVDNPGKQGSVHSVPLHSPGSGHSSWQNQGFSQQEHSNKDFFTASARSDQQTGYPFQDCNRSFAGNVQMDDQFSIGAQHLLQQRNSSYKTHQSQDATLSYNFVHNQESSSSNQMTIDSHVHAPINPEMIGQSDKYYGSKSNHLQEGNSHFNVTREHQTEPSLKLRHKFGLWKADAVSNSNGHTLKSMDIHSRSCSPWRHKNRLSTQSPNTHSSNSSHTRVDIPSPCEDMGYQKDRVSQSPSVSNNTWNGDSGSVGLYESTSKDNYESQRSRNPNPYCREKQPYFDTNEKDRIDSESNQNCRNRSEERSAPRSDMNNRSSSSVTYPDQPTEPANPSTGPRSESINIEDCNVSVSSTPNPPETSSSITGTWNFTNVHLDQEMELTAKILKSICLVEKAKADTYDAERLKDIKCAWELMMEHFHYHAKIMVRYAKKTSGFRDLKLDDQVKLLSGATYNLVLLNHTRAYEPDTGFYNYFNMTKRNWMKVLEYFPEFAVLHTHCRHCGIMAKEIGLTEKEYAYMSSMILLDDECEGIEEIHKVRELKDIFLSAFQHYESENFPKGSLRFGQMLLRLSEFSQFSLQHNMAVFQVMTKHPSLAIPQLYAEMYS